MAGAGYKLFNTGDVLTAAQVNTYLMEQTVMRFATTTARDTALSGVLAEGMLCYIDADNNIYKYTGSAWVNIDTSGGGSPLTTKGDLYTYSTTDARLGVGNNGESLVADSSATTGLRWQGNYAAGKNKIINGDFNINQRGFTSTTTTGAFTFDRFPIDCSGGTATYSAQTFTAGTAPVAGYEATNFLRIVTSGQSGTGDYAAMDQKIENVRTLANQTVTLSFFAKASSGTPKVGTSLVQTFGSGGSSAVITKSGDVTISTSWARYSVTIALPSISGKTIGTNSYLRTLLFTSAGSALNTYTDIGVQNTTIELWGIQLEAGNTATAFQTATGTLAGELAACQRYYYLVVSNDSRGLIGGGQYNGATTVDALIPFPTTMRTEPTLVSTSGTNYYIFRANATDDSFDSVTIMGEVTTNNGGIYTTSGVSGTSGHSGNLYTGNTAASVAFSAEF